MNDNKKLEVIKISWELHNQIETANLNHPAKPKNAEWLEKQRLLLADMALHLLQTSVESDEIKLERLRDNLHAMLTIADQFLTNPELKKATEKLYKA